MKIALVASLITSAAAFSQVSLCSLFVTSVLFVVDRKDNEGDIIIIIIIII